MSNPFQNLRASNRRRGGQSGQGGPQPSWLNRLRKSPRTGSPLIDLHNVLLALKLEPAMNGVFAFDEMKHAVIVMVDPPRSPLIGAGPPTPRALTDDDVSRLQDWLQFMGLSGVVATTVGQAVHVIARDLRFHPVRDYLNGLHWDGTERIGGLFSTYFGADDTEYTRAIGRMFLISMVVRILKPVVKVDHMPILEGPQGLMKSTALETLAGPEYFTDDLPDIHTKDSKQHLRGKWLVEVSELSAFKRASNEMWKAYISRTTEKYRPPYGHEEVEEFRTNVFVGTVNPKGGSGYLFDETGNRRSWPVRCATVKLDDLRADRDQLFAEAADRYSHGELWWPDPEFEAEHMKPEQDARLQLDPWHDPIRSFIENSPVSTTLRTTTVDIAIGALGYSLVTQNGTPINRLGRADANRIIGVLTVLGWENRRTKTDRFWEPSSKPLGVGVMRC